MHKKYAISRRYLSFLSSWFRSKNSNNTAAAAAAAKAVVLPHKTTGSGKIRKRFGPPRGEAKKLAAAAAAANKAGNILPLEQQYTEREKLMLEGVDWRALLYLVAFPVVGAGIVVLLSTELQEEWDRDPNRKQPQEQQQGFRLGKNEWYKQRIAENKQARDEKRAKRLEEEKAQREAELYQQEKQEKAAKEKEAAEALASSSSSSADDDDDVVSRNVAEASAGVIATVATTAKTTTEATVLTENQK